MTRLVCHAMARVLVRSPGFLPQIQWRITNIWSKLRLAFRKDSIFKTAIKIKWKQDAGIFQVSFNRLALEETLLWWGSHRAKFPHVVSNNITSYFRANTFLNGDLSSTILNKWWCGVWEHYDHTFPIFCPCLSVCLFVFFPVIHVWFVFVSLSFYRDVSLKHFQFRPLCGKAVSHFLWSHNWISDMNRISIVTGK